MLHISRAHVLQSDDRWSLGEVRLLACGDLIVELLPARSDGADVSPAEPVHLLLWSGSPKAEKPRPPLRLLPALEPVATPDL